MPRPSTHIPPKSAPVRRKLGKEDTQIDRYELKYVVHPSIVQGIREFIKPFVAEDHHAGPGIPEYTVTTLQLDSPFNSLHYAKELKARNRFKLRIRTYGKDGTVPHFLEIKRKVQSVILKSRVILHPADYSKENLLIPNPSLPFASDSQYKNYLEFVRLVKTVSATPRIFIRYIRESYKGICETYSRVTLDRALSYRPANGSWEFPLKEKNWYCMDTEMALRTPYSGHILELKCGSEMPVWMLELIERFNLVKVGFCKYSAAMRMESLFSGKYYSAASENCTYEDGTDY